MTKREVQERFQAKAAARRSKRAERRAALESIARWEPDELTDDDALELQRLQQPVGRTGRKMRRARKHGIGQTVRALRNRRKPVKSAPPLRLGKRIPKAARLALLREEGRPASGRQWRKLRKAAERAA